VIVLFASMLDELGISDSAVYVLVLDNASKVDIDTLVTSVWDGIFMAMTNLRLRVLPDPARFSSLVLGKSK